MTYIEAAGERYAVTKVVHKLFDAEWDYRDSKYFRIAMSYADAIAVFVDDVPWQHILVDDEGNETAYDASEYCVAGAVIDHRDGTVTVKMGKITDGEALAELREVLNA